MDRSELVTYDVVVVGAGPVGLACAIELKRRGLGAVVLDKGSLVNSLVGYPTNMEFFSTPQLLEIGEHPFPTQRYKPIREDAIDYYTRVAEQEDLVVRLYEEVLEIKRVDGLFRTRTTVGHVHSKYVVVATGFFDVPNFLNVPGESLPHVSHYYKEPFPYTRQKVAIIGAKNSAARAALDCYRHGASVTLVVRGPSISPSVKYWIKPDLENRIAASEVRALFETTVARIEPGILHTEGPTGRQTVEADFVLALTGYRPDYTFLERLGIDIDGDVHRTPVVDARTFQTSVQRMYLAGTVCGGLNTSRWFIENGRFHAKEIAAHIASAG